jgi:hypothetical protein
MMAIECFVPREKAIARFEKVIQILKCGDLAGLAQTLVLTSRDGFGEIRASRPSRFIPLSWLSIGVGLVVCSLQSPIPKANSISPFRSTTYETCQESCAERIILFR